jgi:hypothetical protein
MFRSRQLRFAAIVLFAVAAASLTAASARAFGQGNGTGEGGNSTFADPDEQVNIFGFGFDQAAQPSGLNGPVQVGPQQGQFKHFQIDSLTSPPDPLSRPHQ